MSLSSVQLQLAYLRLLTACFREQLVRGRAKRIGSHINRVRKRIFPPGVPVWRRVKLSSTLNIKVNVGEIMGGGLFLGLPFEPAELRVAQCLSSPGTTIFDIGANIGVYSLLFADWVGEAGRVHAFEPNLDIASVLEENVRSNGKRNVVVNKVALSSEPGTATLFVNSESALSGLRQTGRGRVVREEKVTCITLDEYVRKKGIKGVDLLKMDVEGLEGHVLRGAERLLSESENLIILCELSEKNYISQETSPQSVVQWLMDAGYRGFGIDPDPARKQAVLLEHSDFKCVQNFVFARRDSMALRSIEEAISIQCDGA